ncbi:hypothetical protein [Fibrella aquatilis]|uniref:Uncharacterized protein n=1 Tax=Fibrella aquatilis TaxID=2817059 RepID=A0A939JXJ4_9BACT|nr:hypothetical protein [Fibrella aquatilis]MBO0929393.1 hypothetical protein [Fibrella aquatilis]
MNLLRVCLLLLIDGVDPFRYPHFEGSRGETIIIGTGIGPWCTNDLP